MDLGEVKNKKLNELLNSMWLDAKYGYRTFLGGYVPNENDDIETFKLDLERFDEIRKSTSINCKEALGEEDPNKNIDEKINEIKELIK